MRNRYRLGTQPTDAQLDASGVNVSAVPFLERGYEVIRVGELGIGGAAPKDFVRFPKSAYVAKKPTKEHLGFRESVTEYLIAQLGQSLPVRFAEARLVRLPVKKGEVDDVRFMSRYFLRSGRQSLIHGVELVAQAFGVEKSEVAAAAVATRDESQFYTVNIIDDVLESVSGSQTTHSKLRDGFARMMAFDALIGANDRHAENWGVIEDVETSRLVEFAPVYDTARGLLLWQPDATLREWYGAGDSQAEIRKHALRSKSLVGTGEVEHPNHFQVFEHMVRDRRFRHSLTQVVCAYRPALLRAILCNQFYNLFSRVRLQAISDLLAFRHSVLLETCKSTKLQVR